MAAFASAEELEAFLQMEEDSINEATADLALAIASGVIRSYVGWSISEEVGVELTTEGNGGDAIWLPTNLLTDVTSVEVHGELLTADDHYRWKKSGRVRRVGGRWPMLEQSVEITFTHGFDPVPDEVKGVALILASRIYSNPEGLRSWSVDGLSETIGRQTGDTTGAADVGPTLTDPEKLILAPFLLDGVA